MAQTHTCRLCHCPVAGGGVEIVKLDVDKLAKWWLKSLGNTFDDRRDLKHRWICQFCVWDAKYLHENTPDIAGEDIAWWPREEDQFEKYYLKGMMKPCFVQLMDSLPLHKSMEVGAINNPEPSTSSSEHVQIDSPICELPAVEEKCEQQKIPKVKLKKLCPHCDLWTMFINMHVTTLHKSIDTNKFVSSSIHIPIVKTEPIEEVLVEEKNSVVYFCVFCAEFAPETDNSKSMVTIVNSGAEVTCRNVKTSERYGTRAELEAHIFEEHKEDLDVS